jgi:hypothetical protein
MTKPNEHRGKPVRKGATPTEVGFAALLLEPVSVILEGERQQLSHFEIIVMVTVKAALKGDVRATRNLEKLSEHLGIDAETAAPTGHTGGVLRLSQAEMLQYQTKWRAHHPHPTLADEGDDE